MAVAVAALMSPPSPGGAPADIRWKGAPDLPVETASEPVARVVALVADGPAHLVVVLSGPVGPAERGRLAAAGVVLQAALGADAYFARVEPTVDPAALAAVGGLVHAAPIEPLLKLHPSIRDGRWPDWAREPGRDRVMAIVQCHRDVSPDQARGVVEEVGGVVRARLDAVAAVLVDVTPVAVAALAARDEVMWIEPPLPQLSTTNAENRAITQATLVQASPYALDGAGVQVMVYDGGAAMAGHMDFGGRLIVGDGDNLSNHATHVCGTIAGDGAASGGVHRGMAPAAGLVSYGFQFQGDVVFLYANPGDLVNDYARAIAEHGAALANNSIGTNVALNGFPCELIGDYGMTSAIVDAVVRGGLGAPIGVVWSVGNERESGLCGEAYATIGPPAGAKNHLTVGALDASDNGVTGFTGWGPTDDGRLKPDVCAPGCQSGGDSGVTSTASTGSYAALCGTSMAAPTVTGLAALVLQDHRLQHPHRGDPAPATLKALLVQSAMDIEAPGPDYRTGYGLVQARDAIDLLRTGAMIESTVDQGETLTFAVNVKSSSAPLKVTLAWDDPPATPNVATALINDLDLLVTGPGGAFHPWTLDPDQPAAPASRDGSDRVNNLEQVVVDAPAPGLYEVRVSGFDVADGPQAFSLVAGPGLVATVIALAAPLPAPLPPGASPTVRLDVRSVGESVAPGSVMMHVRHADGPALDVPMSAVGPERYEAALPPAGTCGGHAEVSFSAVGSSSGTVALPSGGAKTPLLVPVQETVVAFADDFETDQGWSVVNSRELVNGGWERGAPAGQGTRGDPLLDADGSGQCFLTDNTAGNSDVDGGATTLVSPAMSAALEDPVIAYARWFSTVQGSNSFQDVMVVEVSDDGGAGWRTLETVGPDGPDVVGGWVHRTFRLADLEGFALNDQFRIRFVVEDAAPSSVVEAAIDAVKLSSAECPDECTGDLDGTGSVDVDDLVLLITSWGPCVTASCPDLDGDGLVGADDLVAMLLHWGACP